MKRFPVIISASARRQINDQVLFIAEDSLDNALAWEARLLIAIRSIGDAPGHAVDEDASERAGYVLRKYVFEGTYLIHHRVNEVTGEIDILNFRHGARLPRRGEP